MKEPKETITLKTSGEFPSEVLRGWLGSTTPESEAGDISVGQEAKVVFEAE